MLRVDKEATKQAKFLDPRSYIGNRIHPGTSHPCVYLRGEDRSYRRDEVRLIAQGKCTDCGVYCWIDGEMDHVEGGLGTQRCDCFENLSWRCGSRYNNCHTKKHGRIPRFGEAAV